MGFRSICLTSVLALSAGSAMAEMNFNRVASFPVIANMAAGEDTSRESSLSDPVIGAGSSRRIGHYRQAY